MMDDVIVNTENTNNYQNSSIGKFAILVQNVVKSYGFLQTQPTLNGINVSVPNGAIYGLLGPSGCGKTTLLRCLVGMMQIDDGFISIFGHKPGSKECGIPGPRVGYMPQETALHGELSVIEHFQYFGSVAGIGQTKLYSRIKFLRKLLLLPKDSRICHTLSGGQQRRVSFAISVLHEPELLILDEPTVGVDPPMRKRIWDYLYLLAKNQHKTIILTTHYIEETRTADVVGLMINGSLLAESPPEKLLQQYQCETLEEVFLALCLKNSQANAENQIGANDSTTAFIADINLGDKKHEFVHGMLDRSHSYVSRDVKKKYSAFSRALNNISKLKSEGARRCKEIFTDGLPSIRGTMAVSKKHLNTTRHDFGAMLFQFLLPCIITVAFFTTMGLPITGLKLGLVNHDNDELSQVSIDKIRSMDIMLEEYSTIEEARQAVLVGKTWGIVGFRENFTMDTFTRYLYGQDTSEEELLNSRLYFTLDYSSHFITLTIRERFYAAYQETTGVLLSKMGLHERFGDIPLQLSSSTGHLTRSVQEYLTPGIMMSAMYFLPMALTSIVLLLERLSGQLERSLVAGVKPVEIITALVFNQSIVTIVQVLMIYLIATVVFRLQIVGSHALGIFMCIVQGTCGMGYGMFVSSICDSITTAGVVSIGTFLPICVLSGIFWPLEGMSVPLRTFARVLPPTMPTEGLRSIIFHGASLIDYRVYSGILISMSWFLVFIPMSLIFFSLHI